MFQTGIVDGIPLSIDSQFLTNFELYKLAKYNIQFVAREYFRGSARHVSWNQEECNTCSRVVQRAFESSRQCMNSQSNARRQLKQEDKTTEDVIYTHLMFVDRFFAQFIIIGINNYNFYTYTERTILQRYLKVYKDLKLIIYIVKTE